MDGGNDDNEYGGVSVMRDHFDVIENLYDIFSSSTELTALLGTTPTNLETLDTVIRRSFADVTTIKPEELPWIDVGWIESNGKTGNFLVNREVIEINIYTHNYHMAGQIYKELHRLLSENFESMQTINAAQRSLPVSGVYCFSFRVKSFVKA